jgi:hypothetical protein
MRILAARLPGVACLCALLLAVAGTSHAGSVEGFGKLPLAFEPNRGQTDAQVAFLARGAGFQLFLTPTEAVYKLQRDADAGVVRMELVGARGGAIARGVDRLEGQSHYLAGAGRDHGITHVPQYARVELPQVYQGIDLAYYGNASQLEYDFTVAPRAEPRRIAIAMHGARRLEIDGEGRLLVHTQSGVIAWKRPVAWQEVAGARRAVPAAYVLRGKNRFGFRVGSYDRAKPLVIDPILAYSTLLGGTGHDHAVAIAVDASAAAVITGATASIDFPVTAGAVAAGGGVFVARLNPAGTALEYSTFLGPGSGAGIALHEGSAYVTGLAFAGFPATAGAYNDGQPGSNAFVAKLSPDGSSLVYSALFGGGLSRGTAIAVDASGNAHVTGTTQSPAFPTTPGAFQPSRPTLGQVFEGDIDAFFVKLNASGSTLLYSTYLGSTENDYGEGIAVDASGKAYVAGTTTGRSAPWNGFPAADLPFPTTGAAFQTAFTGGASAFVAKFDPGASGAASLVYSTLLGGSNESSQGHGVAVDGAGNAYVTGSGGPGYPLTAGAYGSATATGGAFVTRVDATGSALGYSAIIAGAQGRGIALDSARNAFVTGLAEASEFTVVNPLPQFPGGSVFVTKIAASGATAAYSTFIDGHTDVGLGIAVDPFGAAYVAGTAFQSFFTTPGAYQGAIAGGTDGFVTKIVTNQPPVASAGAAQSATAGVPFTLDAGGSFDPDGDALTFVWRDSANAIVGNSQTVTLARAQGLHIFTVTVSDGASSASASVQVTVEAVLSINLYGPSSVAVASSDGKINCTPSAGAVCSARYADPAAVTLTAMPGAGVVFAGWDSPCAGTGQCTVMVSGNVTVGARFDTQGITLAVSNPGHGSITSPAEINCGSTCSVVLPFGTEVVLTAVADRGYLFGGWSGDCSGTAPTCSLILDANKSVAASFQQVTVNALSVAPAAATVTVGGQHRFAATANFSDGSTRVVSGEHSVEGSDGDVCAITRDGTVRCWGTRYPVPATIPAFEKAIALSAGTLNICALFADGTVNCEGSAMPVTGAAAIASQSQINCALLGNHTVQCWNGASLPVTIVTVGGISDAVAIGAEGGPGACAVHADGSVSCWIGLGDGVSGSPAQKIDGVVNATSVAMGVGHGCALIADGTVACWGENFNGQVGNGLVCPTSSPSPPAPCTGPTRGFTVVEPNPAGPAPTRPLADVVSVVAGDYHSCALTANGTVKCWGRAFSGGSNVDSAVAIPVASLTAVSIAAGAFTTCATLADATLSCWGDRASGGLPLPQRTLVPQPVAGMENILGLSWASANPAVSRMTSNGVATGMGTGATTISALSGASSASAGLTVTAGSSVTARALSADATAPLVTVSFPGLSQAGVTTLAATNPCPSPPPSGFQLGSPAVCLDLATTAAFTPPATACIAYDATSFAGTPQLFHFEGGTWTDVTTSVDAVNRIVCGAVSSFSPFALMEPANRSLVADAGPDRDVECTAPGGTPVTLDGSGSSRGPGLAYLWTGSFGTAVGMIATVQLPLGTHGAKLAVSDGRAQAEDEVRFTVRDTRPPAISAAFAEPAILWPPNGKMVPVTVAVSVADVCDARARCRIETVTSNEATRRGDGPDWEITGALTLRLRADRAGQGSGRAYSIEVACTDESGNRALRTVVVTVPHSR